MRTPSGRRDAPASRSSATCSRKVSPRRAKSRPKTGYSTGRSPLATPSSSLPLLSRFTVAADLSVSIGSRSGSTTAAVPSRMRPVTPAR